MTLAAGFEPIPADKPVSKPLSRVPVHSVLLQIAAEAKTGKKAETRTNNNIFFIHIKIVLFC
jgi:hypothetical protein